MGADRGRVIFRLLIVLAAAFGVGTRIVISFTAGHGFPVFLYFTIQSNILVLVFLIINLVPKTTKSFESPILHGGILLYIIITAVVYNALLAPGIDASGLNLIILTINHTITPLMFLADWLFAGKRVRLEWKHLGLWLIYPLIYLASASIEGALTGVFRYPFLDFLNQKPAAYAAGLFIVTAAFIIVGAAIIFTDKRLEKMQKQRL